MLENKVSTELRLKELLKISTRCSRLRKQREWSTSEYEMESRMLENNVLTELRLKELLEISTRCSRLRKQREGSKTLSVSKGTRGNSDKDHGGRRQMLCGGKCLKCGKSEHRTEDYRSKEKQGAFGAGGDEKERGDGR